MYTTTTTTTFHFFLLLFLISACSQDGREQVREEENTQIETVLSNNKTVSKNENNPTQKKDSVKKKVAKKEDTSSAKTETNDNTSSSNTSARTFNNLMKKLDRKLKIEFVTPDFTIIKDDTLFKSKEKTFEVSYITSCLNDSLIAQEMFDYGGTNKKSYLISHNYQTNIAIKVNGKLTGRKTIEKYLFEGKLDKEFLEKSIIKHPQFVRFDESNNEAIFEFLVGVPHTDWVIVAGINLDQQGIVRVIDIMMPDM